jgi:D-hydroxyproline dehydrogenase subunit beta
VDLPGKKRGPEGAIGKFAERQFEMRENVGIVGAGIVGLAHAWSAAERGHQVTVFERTPMASGASIRNFGMVWPIGQPEPTRNVALLSRQRWLQLAQASGIWANPYGSLHLAHHADEWEVLQEFYARQQGGPLAAHLQLLVPDAALARSPAIQPVGFRGALASDLEICVNPTETLRQLPIWLEQTFGVNFQFQTTVVDVESGRLKTAARQSFGFERIIICSGHDLETLYPAHFAELPLRKCKLQMMRTVPQANAWKLGAHLASGLTLRHYHSFQSCASLQEVVARIASQSPELDELGIHVMAAQDNHGRIVLGDSHEYDDRIEPFDARRIDELILRELRKIICLPDWTMDSHWHGIYAKLPTGPAVVRSPEPGVYLCTGLGGAGMTLSFGVAEENWQQWTEPK